MPKPLQFRAGSIIYMRGDPADRVFILQSGRVNLIYQDIETGMDQHDLVQPGEFFGVKSALGKYPREEDAATIQDTVIMAFTVAEFETLAMANTRIIMKMLKVFSNQMRRIHRQVSSLMEEEEVDQEAGLFNVGEYYLKNKRFAQAKYVFGRYLTYHPSGRHAAQAAKNLEIASGYAGQSRPSPPAGQGYASSAPAGPAPQQAPRPAAAPAELSAAAKTYYDAVSLISQEKYQQAYLAFKRIVDADEDPEYAAKSVYEIGRCLFLLNKLDDCVRYFTMMITKYPKHPDLRDAIFYIGQSYEKKGSKDQAAAFYKKILTMSSDDDDGTAIKAKRALKALAGG